MGILNDIARRDLNGKCSVEDEFEGEIYGKRDRIDCVLKGTYRGMEYSIDSYCGKYPRVIIARCPEIHEISVYNLIDSKGVMRQVFEWYKEFFIVYNVAGVDYMDNGEVHIEGEKHPVKKLVMDAKGYIDQIIDIRRRWPVY